MDYEVKREHIGDRAYAPGDIRTADPSTVDHLVRNGVLVEAVAEELVEEVSQTKVEPALDTAQEAEIEGEPPAVVEEPAQAPVATKGRARK